MAGAHFVWWRVTAAAFASYAHQHKGKGNKRNGDQQELMEVK